MIKRIRHKGVDRFYGLGDSRGIDARQAARLRILLTALNTASRPENISLLPGSKLHPLKGERKGQWAVWVSGNWRLIFEFDGEDATNIDLIDYH